MQHILGVVFKFAARSSLMKSEATAAAATAAAGSREFLAQYDICH